MIRRTANNKATPSLVNTANQDHLNVTRAIKDTAPIVDLTSVARSINFDAATDGSYILRDPLILKDKLAATAFYLYDDATVFNKWSDLFNTTQIISSEKVLNVLFRYYDKTFKKFDIPITNEMSNLSFIETYYKHAHSQDSTLISVRIDRAKLDAFVSPYPSILYDDNYLKYGNLLYRLLKIYKDPDLEDTWIVELISPEIGSITSATDATNPESLEFNLLLDNPLAIRDLYNYGSNATTKILAYVVKSDLNIATYPVYALTEANNPKIKLIESLNTVQYSNDNIYLKAFISTMRYIDDSALKFYCVWEYSTNGGIDWKPVPQFLKQFEAKGMVVTKNVSDITAEGFENLTEDESLTKSADYIVSKDLVYFNPNASETDIIDNRPDVLKLTSNQLSYLFRFQVYVDTDKKYPKVEDELSNITLYEYMKNNFQNTGASEETIFENNVAIYRSYNCAGNSDDGKRTFNSKVTVTVEGADFICYIEDEISTASAVTTDCDLYLKQGEDDFYIKAGTLHPAPDPSDESSKPYSDDFEKGFATFKSAEALSEAIVANTNNYTPAAPEIGASNTLILHNGNNNMCGNSVVISCSNKEYKIYGVKVTLGTSETDSDSNTLYASSTIGCRFGSAIVEEDISNFECQTLTATTQGTFLYHGANVDDERKKAEDSDVITVACCSTSSDSPAKIAAISILVKHITEPIKTTSTYLVSSTGYFSFNYSENLTPVGSNLLDMHENLFKGTLSFYDEQLLSNYKGYVYVSGLDSLIFKITNTILLGTNVTKILKWRSYIVIFTEISIYLAKYDLVNNSYSLKVISTNIGLSAVDADTATVILNNIYFKNKEKIYSLAPNPYSSDDSILNIKYISEDILTFLSDLQIYCLETHNFKYSDAKYYYIFIPTNYDLENGNSTLDVTYCLKYNYVSKTWTILKYPVHLLDVEDLSITESYLRTSLGLCYFNQDVQIIYANYIYKTTWLGLGYAINQAGVSPGQEESAIDLGYTDDENLEHLHIVVFADEVKDDIINHESLLHLYQQLPFADYHKYTLAEINQFVIEHQHSNSVNDFKTLFTQIPFIIDFGQKSSNYTLDKQFLETKMIFGTLQLKDVFPVTLDIETDGESPTIHIDANTDSALWKVSSDQKGTLGTTFATVSGINYNGIMRQLIVKYSGRGKTIRHYLSGNSITRFKFYSLDSRYRILPKKQ